MTILVAGADRIDAGKTTFSLGLVETLDGTGFKPRAGNDYWFDHDDYRAVVPEGRLYGKDARQLAAVSDVRPEAINPVHRLWRPAPSGDPFIGAADRMFLLDRIGDSYVVNDEAPLPESARANLPLDEAIRVSSVEELNQVIEREYLPQFQALAERIDDCEHAVVESYGDVARPLQDINVTRVAVVEPGRVRIYAGDRYWNACEIATGRPETGQLEERVGDVVELLDPIVSVDLPPLPDAARTDPTRIASAYESAYSSLVGQRH